MSETTTHARATFSHMEQGTREDWAAISAEFMPFAQALADRVVLIHHGRKVADGPLAGIACNGHGSCIARVTFRCTDCDLEGLLSF